METFDKNPTTRTRMILEELRKQEEARILAQRKIEEQVSQVAKSIDAFRAEMKKRTHWTVRLWVWVKSVLSFAHGEAEKIRLDE